MIFLAGEIIRNRYRIVQLLASGGMGIVYLARDESLGVDVALKVSLAGGISFERTKDIAALLAGLHHANIPRVTDTFALPAGEQVLVMDFIPGEDLRSRVERAGPLSLQESLTIIREIGSALQYLHNQTPPLIHLDVKPGNVRLTPNGETMLVDFDLMTVIQPNNSIRLTDEKGLTPGFAAPEQYKQEAGVHSDQYALAATLYYMLTGVRLADALSRASGNLSLPVNPTRNTIPVDVLTCLERALSINPASRFPDIGAFLTALPSNMKVEFSGNGNMTKELRPQGKKRISRKLVIPVLIGLTGLGVLGFAGLMINHNNRTNSQINIQTPQDTPISPTKTPTQIEIIVPGQQQNDQKIQISPIASSASSNTALPNPIPTPFGGSGEFVFVSEIQGNPQIFLGSTDSDETRRLTDFPDGACQPDWSPDGEQLVFISPCQPRQQLIGKNQPYAGSGLFILAIENGTILPIPSLPGGDFDPVWSPDGKRIAFTSLRRKYAQIFVYDIINDTTTQITNTTSENKQPSWSPDGNTIAYNTARSGTSQIWLMRSDGSQPTEFSLLTNGAAFSPAWSPDGKEIVYSQTNSLRLASRAVENNGTSENILNPRLNLAANPDYSPDGNWILIDSNIDGSHRVYRISRTGTGLEPLSPVGEIAYQPDWKP